MQHKVWLLSLTGRRNSDASTNTSCISLGKFFSCHLSTLQVVVRLIKHIDLDIKCLTLYIYI